MLFKMTQEGIAVSIGTIAHIGCSHEQNEVTVIDCDGEQTTISGQPGAVPIFCEVYTDDGVLMMDFTLEARKH